MTLAALLWMSREPLPETLDRVARSGIRGVEIDADLDFDPAEVNRLLFDRGLTAVGTVAQMANEGNDLISSHKSVRWGAEKYIEKAIDFTAAIGGEVIVVVPSQIGKTEPEAEPDEEWGWAVEGLRRIALHAVERKVKIALEPIGRGETYFLTRAAQAIRLAEDVGSPAVGVCLDAANMYAEERDPVAAIEAAGDLLFDFHLADSNRRPVGEGVVDWPSIFAALQKVQYQGPLGVELLEQHDRSPLREADPEPDADMFSMSGAEFERGLMVTAEQVRALAGEPS